MGGDSEGNEENGYPVPDPQQNKGKHTQDECKQNHERTGRIKPQEKKRKGIRDYH
jgi:hypothetical protein